MNAPYDPRPSGLCINDPLAGNWYNPAFDLGSHGRAGGKARPKPVSVIVLRTFERLDFKSMIEASEKLKISQNSVAEKQCRDFKGYYIFDPTDPQEPNMDACEALVEAKAPGARGRPVTPLWVTDTKTGASQRYPSQFVARLEIGRFPAEYMDSDRLWKGRYRIQTIH